MKRRTQNQKLLAALRSGVRLTPYSALRIAGTLRLSERMRECEASGHRIHKRLVKVGRAHVMSYCLER